MASHTKKDDYCLECHWEAFHLDGKDSEDSQETTPAAATATATATHQPSQWDCPGEEHHASLAHCEVDETCCDEDHCSVDCGSVCDGFVECDESTACSAVHCDDNCDDNNCDDNCENPDPACFEDHCFGHNDSHVHGTDHSLESLLGLGAPLTLESNDLLPSASLDHSSEDQLSKATGNPGFMGPTPSADHFISPFSTTLPHCHPQNMPHFHCHDFPKEVHDNLMNPSYPLPNAVNPAEVFHMLGMCPDLSACQNFHVHEDQTFHHQPPSEPPTQTPSQNQSPDPNSFACFHIPHFNVNDLMKSPAQLNGNASRGPCRSHHRCRSHAHAHTHHHPYAHYSPFSRHSRSSISSQLLSSPGESPPPLEGGSSVLTSPDFSPTDRDLHVCKWVSSSNGIKTTCGATFPDSCALQEHLISRHMATVEGAKGTGYYCCWEGCHRPDEPFSQKSKLQGHFLTHSNYKNFRCSVCGKFFARQATLERHERSHRGEKPYKCSVCGKSFTDSSELKTHSRTHSGEKPFKCTYPGCNFQTGDSSNMSSHRLTHGERRHKCIYPGCTKSFTRPDQLKRHMRSTHKDETSMMSPLTDTFDLSFPTVA
ncbi:hypothetical protein P170DRAFT_65826 [Aspergillus steynii IBT 23096]|uniref:C2H2-type domain-containing protein n=1 Tax=Aspergillus steynii IBT 23096 TaxID=1392250 RepID=A0A2I2FTI2_9EURO|nr:uncharacterized protein P170DRAFT_65826 [Aspergillus steynii IBT 23096]PLB43932.1 hypothetical protein P170DRAFT_65826 [Aspergillus steynii IBT 23096]